MSTAAVRRDPDYADAVASIRYIGGKTMRQKLFLSFLCSAVVIGVAPPAHAQSLADMAPADLALSPRPARLESVRRAILHRGHEDRSGVLEVAGQNRVTTVTRVLREMLADVGVEQGRRGDDRRLRFGPAAKPP